MIHTVKTGDTLYEISRTYDIPLDTLISLNGIQTPDKITIGQNIFIPENLGSTQYIVRQGDTLYRIARSYGIELNQLIQANPQIQDLNQISIGQTIYIPDRRNSIEVNGYAIANINENILRQTLPYLTYLSIFSYQAKANGDLFILYEDAIINQARNAQVAPIMVVTNIAEGGGFDSDIAHEILATPSTQQNLINNITRILTAKNYYGVDIDFEYIYPQDKMLYTQFLRNLKNALTPINKRLSVAVAPKYSDFQSGILYEGFDYKEIGEVADRVIIMTYEWGYTYGEPRAISPINEVERVISYAITRIPSEKILMGMPNYAYDWTLPWKSGDAARAISNRSAIQLAIDRGATIQFDNLAQAPYFNYTENGVEHIVWFDDAKSISARLMLVDKYNLAGVSYWTINNYFAVNWSIIDDQFSVKKVF